MAEPSADQPVQNGVHRWITTSGGCRKTKGAGREMKPNGAASRSESMSGATKLQGMTAAPRPAAASIRGWLAELALGDSRGQIEPLLHPLTGAIKHSKERRRRNPVPPP